MKIIIGLTGVKTSGKSTVANIIKKNINAKEIALADKLKNVSAKIFNIPREYFDRQDLKEIEFQNGPKILTVDKIQQILKEFNIEMSQECIEKTYNILNMKLFTPRKIAQIAGTEILRAAGDEDIHCKNIALNDGLNIISDIRFPNEFDYFYNKSDFEFIPLYIQRNEAEKHITKDSHPSEKCVFQFSNKCIKINNNNDLEYTERQIINILTEKGLLTKILNRA